MRSGTVLRAEASQQVLCVVSVCSLCDCVSFHPVLLFSPMQIGLIGDYKLPLGVNMRGFSASVCHLTGNLPTVNWDQIPPFMTLRDKLA